MYPSLQLKLDRFEELERMLQDPAVLSNPSKSVDVQREYGGLRKVAESVRNFLKLEADLAAATEFLMKWGRLKIPSSLPMRSKDSPPRKPICRRSS